jgi:hypothetical protein
MKTTFLANKHGYQFPNRFELDWMKAVFKKSKNKYFYGLCGGMCFSALDHFYENTPLPPYTDPEEIPQNYVNYLWSRQLNSTSLKQLSKLFISAAQNKQLLLDKTIKHEIPLIISRINRNIPVPIIICRSRLLENPTDNHQIILTGCRVDEGYYSFYCFDPNHPGLEPTIQVSTDLSKGITQNTGEKIIAFFINSSYQQKRIFQKT